MVEFIPIPDMDSVQDLFAAISRDRTPALARDSARVIFAPFTDDPEISTRCAAVLTSPEIQRAERFVVKKYARHFIERRAFRRYCGALALGWSGSLSDIRFNETDKGRPHIPDRSDLWFSFSSCRLGYLGAWSSAHAIGVDIEVTTRTVEAAEVSQRYFSETETEAINAADESERQAMFFRLWCLKEAALKSIGEGLPFGLDKFQFDTDLKMQEAPDPHKSTEFNTFLFDEDTMCAAVVVRSLDG